MGTKTILVCICVQFYPTALLIAQSPNTWRLFFDGDVRYRYEHWNNMNAKSYGPDPEIGQPNDDILLQRIIAGFTMQFNNHLKISAHIQDSRAFGWSLANHEAPDAFKIHQENSMDPSYTMNPNEEFFEIYDANIQIDSLFNCVSIIAGRQKIAFTDYRVFGPGNWGNTGRWNWDAVQLKIDKTSWTAAIWYGGTKINDPQKTHLPFTYLEYFGGGIHTTVRIKDILYSDLYLAHKRQGSAAYIREKNMNRNWAGLRVYNPPNIPWKYEIGYTFEHGREADRNIKAHGLFLRAGYQFESLYWRPCLSFRYTYASGDTPQSADDEKFDPVFGAGDKYYGWMNLVKWSNLDDREIMLELYPTSGMRAELKYNILKIPEPEDVTINGNLMLPSGSNHLGNEVDLLVNYEINESWQLTLLTGYFALKDAVTFTSINPGDSFYISAQACYTFKIKL
jgi:hypothetical protein